MNRHEENHRAGRRPVVVLKEKHKGVRSMAASRVQRVVLAPVDQNNADRSTVDRIVTVETVIVKDAPNRDRDQKLAEIVPKVAHKVDVHQDIRRVDLVMADLAANRAIVRDLLVEKVGLKEIVDRAARKAKVVRSVAKLL